MCLSRNQARQRFLQSLFLNLTFLIEFEWPLVLDNFAMINIHIICHSPKEGCFSLLKMPASTYTHLGCTRTPSPGVWYSTLVAKYRTSVSKLLNSIDPWPSSRPARRRGHKKQCDLAILSWLDIRGHHRYFYRFGCSHIILIIFTLSWFYHTRFVSHTTGRFHCAAVAVLLGCCW